MAFLSIDKQWELISRGAEEIIPEKELKQKLEESIEKESPLRVKLDPIFISDMVLFFANYAISKTLVIRQS